LKIQSLYDDGKWGLNGRLSDQVLTTKRSSRPTQTRFASSSI
jgi:hypothetical protein